MYLPVPTSCSAGGEGFFAFMFMWGGGFCGENFCPPVSTLGEVFVASGDMVVGMGLGLAKSFRQKSIPQNEDFFASWEPLDFRWCVCVFFLQSLTFLLMSMLDTRLQKEVLNGNRYTLTLVVFRYCDQQLRINCTRDVFKFSNLS